MLKVACPARTTAWICNFYLVVGVSSNQLFCCDVFRLLGTSTEKKMDLMQVMNQFFHLPITFLSFLHKSGLLDFSKVFKHPE